MKIKIKEILPNPFKSQIVGGKLNDKKIRRLMESIETTDFWDNLLVRQHPTDSGKYELAYGHHRLEAVRRLWGNDTYVDLPVRNLDDEDMLRIMSNENVESEEGRTQYQIDTVLAVKKFMENHVQPLDVPRNQYERDGVIGSRQISAFLGEQNWSKSKVADLLKLYTNLDVEIQEQLVSHSDRNQGDSFRGLSKTTGVALASLGKDSEYQKPLAKVLQEKELGKGVAQAAVAVLKDEDYTKSEKHEFIKELGLTDRSELSERKVNDTIGNIIVEKHMGKTEKTVPTIERRFLEFDRELRKIEIKVEALQEVEEYLASLEGASLLLTLKRVRDKIDQLIGEDHENKTKKEQDSSRDRLIYKEHEKG